jgi:hypothetical protein
MTVKELRGLLLEKYYQRRKERLIVLQPSDFDGKLSGLDIMTVAGQLADHQLIHWRSNPGSGGIGGGMGTITAAGIDVVERRLPAPMEIQWSRDARTPGSAACAASGGDGIRDGVGDRAARESNRCCRRQRGAQAGGDLAIARVSRAPACVYHYAEGG